MKARILARIRRTLDRINLARNYREVQDHEETRMSISVAELQWLKQRLQER